MKFSEKSQVRLLFSVFLSFFILSSIFSQTEISSNALVNIIKDHKGLSDANILNIKSEKYVNDTLYGSYHVVINYLDNDIKFKSEFIVFPKKNVVIPRISNLTGDLFKIDLLRLNAVLCEKVDFFLFAEFINFLVYCNNILDNTQKENLNRSIQDSSFIKEKLKSDYIDLIKKTDLSLRVTQHNNFKNLIFFVSKGLSYNIIRIEILFDSNNKIVSYNYQYVLNQRLELVEFSDITVPAYP